MTRSTSILTNSSAALAFLAFFTAGPGCTKSPQKLEAFPVDTTPEVFVALGHSGDVTSLAFSPDARYALSGSEDHTVKLWDLTARKLVRTWQGQRLGIRGNGEIRVEFSPDGRRFLAMSWDGDLVLVDLASGRKILAFEHPSMAFATFSPNGEYVLSGGYDGKAKLWSVVDQKEVQSYDLSSYGVLAGVFLRNGSRAVCGDKGGRLHLLDLENEERLLSTQDDGPAIFALGCSPDGTQVISVNSAGTVESFDAGTLARKKQLLTGAVLYKHSASISRDGASAAIEVLEGNTLILWDLANSRALKTIAQGIGIVGATCFSPDGSLLLSGGLDNSIDLYDLDAGGRKLSFPGQKRTAKGVACAPDATTMLAAWIDWFTPGNILINRWDAGHGVLRKQMLVPPHFDFVISSDLGSAYTDHTVWNTLTGEKVLSVPVDGDQSVSVYFPDGTHLLTGDLEGTVKIIEIPSGRQLLSFKAHQEQLMALAVSRDGALFATGSHANQDNLKVWSAVDGRLVRAFSQNDEFINAIAFLPDGRHILTGPPSSPAVMKLWDISTGEMVRVFAGHEDEVHALAVSQDGSLAVSGGMDTEVKVWDVASGNERVTFRGHADDVRAVAITPDNKHVVSVSDDGTARLWDVTRGAEIAQFVAFEDGEWVVMTPEGIFNASPGGGQHLNVRIVNDVYSIDNFFEKFFDPVRVAAALGGGSGEPATAGPDLRKGVLPPPRVRILSPNPNTTRTTDSVTVAVSATDMGGGVDEIRLYQNGKAIGEDTRGMRPVTQANEVIRTFSPLLVEGVNTFRAVAFSKDRTESHAAEVSVTLEAPRQEASLYVLTVGINEYQNRTLNLNFAKPDAEAIAAFFRRSGGRLFKSVHVREVYNDQATKAGILSAISALRGTRPQDAVVMYLAGHGESINDQWYFLPHELTYPEREDEVRGKALSSTELRGAMKEVTAQKILLLIDACKSGAVMVAFRGFEDRKALSQLSRATGVHVVAASTKDQFAAEVKDLGHGVFTYTLLAGLNGQASRGNEPVTVRKLMGYVEETLPGLTQKYKQEAQYPVVDSRGMDFPLVPGR